MEKEFDQESSIVKIDVKDFEANDGGRKKKWLKKFREQSDDDEN